MILFNYPSVFIYNSISEISTSNTNCFRITIWNVSNCFKFNFSFWINLFIIFKFWIDDFNLSSCVLFFATTLHDKTFLNFTSIGFSSFKHIFKPIIWRGFWYQLHTFITCIIFKRIGTSWSWINYFQSKLTKWLATIFVSCHLCSLFSLFFRFTTFRIAILCFCSCLSCGDKVCNSFDKFFLYNISFTYLWIYWYSIIRISSRCTHIILHRYSINLSFYFNNLTSNSWTIRIDPSCLFNFNILSCRISCWIIGCTISRTPTRITKLFFISLSNICSCFNLKWCFIWDRNIFAYKRFCTLCIIKFTGSYVALAFFC